MKQVVVAIYDSAVKSYNRPFTVPSEGLAVRMFSDEVNRKSDDNPMHRHSSDFVLYKLAEWDDEVGTFENVVPPGLLAKASDFLVD